MTPAPGIGSAIPAGQTPDPSFGGWPPWEFQPLGATPVDRTSDPVTVAAGAEVEVFALRKPAHLMLRIREIGLYCGDPAGLPFATWSVRVDGEGIDGYSNIPVAIGSISDPAAVSYVCIVPRDARVQIFVANGAGSGAFDYRARMRGHFFALSAQGGASGV